MALRATAGPALASKSAKVGEVVTVTAKVENSGAGGATVGCHVEGLVEGALSKPVAFAFLFDPPSAAAPAKSRTRMEFRWKAALPEGKTAFTFRGKLVLREVTTGALVGQVDLDLYVGGA